jgi:hypothetical protein
MTRCTETGPGRRNVCFSVMTTSMAMQNTLSAESQPLGLNEELNSAIRSAVNSRMVSANDEIHQHSLVDGRDCAGEEHESESEVYCNSSWARLADHRNENSHKHQKCEEEAQMSILTPETGQPPIVLFVSHLIFSFRLCLIRFLTEHL